jgi:hypothetical protein
VLNLDNGSFGIDHVEVKHRVNLYRDVVARDDILVGISMTWMRKSTLTLPFPEGTESAAQGRGLSLSESAQV